MKTLKKAFLASYTERVTQQGIIDVGLSDYQKFLGLEEARTDILNSAIYKTRPGIQERGRECAECGERGERSLAFRGIS